MSYLVYQHYRKDKGEVFYVGISSNIKRPYKKSNRSSFWKKIINKTDYDVEILFNDLTKIQAEIIEKELIKFYGRRDLGTGTLCNLTDGGEGGSLGIIQSKETREKKRQANYKRKYKRGYKNVNYPVEKVSKSIISISKLGDIKLYSSIIEASRITKINISNICQVCKGKRKTAGGFIWKYKEL